LLDMHWLALVVTLALPLDTDAMRGALYRIDAEARLVRQHPEEAAAHAQAAERQARDVQARLAEDPALAPEASRLMTAAIGLSDAARADREAAVRDAARDVQVEVRRLDALLPAPPLAK
jgi:hypothetical protein